MGRGKKWRGGQEGERMGEKKEKEGKGRKEGREKEKGKAWKGREIAPTVISKSWCLWLGALLLVGCCYWASLLGPGHRGLNQQTLIHL